VFTVPRLLRPMFARRRAWLGELCRIAARLLEKACRAAVPVTRRCSGRGQGRDAYVFADLSKKRCRTDQRAGGLSGRQSAAKTRATHTGGDTMNERALTMENM